MNLEDIIKSQDTDIKKALLIVAEELKQEKESSFNSFIEMLSKIVDGQQILIERQEETSEILREISAKEYPEIPLYPSMPEFPKEIRIKNPVSEVSISKPEWWKDVSLDTSQLEKKIEENTQFLGEILIAIKGIPNVGEQKEGILSQVSSLIGARRNISKLVRNKPEVPRGTIDGSNKDFYLSRIPFAGFLILATNGAQQKKDEDFTLDGAKITYTVAPPTSSNHQAVFF